MTRSTVTAGLLALAASLSICDAAGAQTNGPSAPVKVVAPDRMEVASTHARGTIPLYASHDLAAAGPAITRAVIVLHGRLRNGDVYKRSADLALAAAGADPARVLLVVPQFLAPPDIAAHALRDDMLRWGTSSWMGGEPSLGAAISSFEVLDAILDRLADRRLFPALDRIVVAGHSGGGQVVARYAAVAKAESRVAAKGIAVRYVIANPSSYLYFSPERPGADGAPAPFDAAACPTYNDWKYGPFKPVPYAKGAPIDEVEKAFAARDVVYLLGTADTDPNHPALDKSCAAEAQGAYRYARGIGYVRYLRSRHGEALRHRLLEVPGVGHDGEKMFTGACGRAALFDVGTCATSR